MLVNRSFSRSLIRLPQVSFCLIALPGLVSLPSLAQDEQDLIAAKQQKYLYAKCANRCQVNLDRNLSTCVTLLNKPREDLRPNCAIIHQEQYQLCLEVCPVPGRQ